VSKRYISVYSGAGGFDLGLVRAGFTPALMVDESRSACSTLRAAVPDAAVLPADIHDLLNTGTVATLTDVAPAVLVAGQPPVLSTAAARSSSVDPEDDAPQLMYRFLDVVAQGRPDAFIMAVMPFLTSSRWAPVLARLRRTARDLGYDTFTPVIDAAEYGTPQHRDRLFFIGMPKGAKPDTAAAFRANGKVSAGTALRAAQVQLTRDISCPSGVRLAARPVLRNSPYSGMLLAGPGRMLDLRKVAPVLPAALGGNKTPVLDTAQLESGTSPHIEGYHDYLWRLNGTPDKYGEDITRYMRRLSLRECAALQGFPPNYPLRGAPLAQFKLIGSAVPPPLAEAVGRAVMAGLS
jgi:DNA (cytosine-5)-methyltransferase 1